jgi:hypothetical protein
MKFLSFPSLLSHRVASSRLDSWALAELSHPEVLGSLTVVTPCIPTRSYISKTLSTSKHRKLRVMLVEAGQKHNINMDNIITIIVGKTSLFQP